MFNLFNDDWYKDLFKPLDSRVWSWTVTQEPQRHFELKDGKYVCKLPLPGLGLEDVKVFVEDNKTYGNSLVVEWEENGKKCSFLFYDPVHFDFKDVKASMKNGVLTLTAEPKKKPDPKLIEVTQG